MAFTESKMIALGTQAPDFCLPDTVSDELMSLSDVQGSNGTVVMFLCNHCPYVLHVNEEIVRVVEDYEPKGIGFVGISSNDVDKYPEDSPELMKVHAANVGYNFPYLFDELQTVAKDYDAACTPDFYLFDQDLKLVYRGRLDDSRPNSGKPLTGTDLRQAIDNLLAGKPISETQYPSGGCGIKWKNA